MADSFFNSKGVDVGYRDKRKKQMREQFSKGLNMALGKRVENNVQSKKKPTAKKVKDQKKIEKDDDTDKYEKKETSRGTMYFKNNLIVSKDEYEKNAGKDK